MTDRDDSTLFRETVGRVRVIKHDQVELRPKSPTPEPRQSQADEKLVINELLVEPWAADELETGEELNHARDGVQKRVLRRLKRGYYSVSDEIDLHHMNAATAQEVLFEFIALSRERGYTCVKVIHGKGLRSRSKGPVLKRMVDHWLRRHPQVVAFTSARQNDGGTGAVYVLLKR